MKRAAIYLQCSERTYCILFLIFCTRDSGTGTSHFSNLFLFSSYSGRFVAGSIGPLRGFSYINTRQHKYITKASIFRPLNVFKPTKLFRAVEGTA